MFDATCRGEMRHVAEAGRGKEVKSFTWCSSSFVPLFQSSGVPLWFLCFRVILLLVLLLCAVYVNVAVVLLAEIFFNFFISLLYPGTPYAPGKIISYCFDFFAAEKRQKTRLLCTKFCCTCMCSYKQSGKGTKLIFRPCIWSAKVPIVWIVSLLNRDPVSIKPEDEFGF